MQENINLSDQLNSVQANLLKEYQEEDLKKSEETQGEIDFEVSRSQESTNKDQDLMKDKEEEKSSSEVNSEDKMEAHKWKETVVNNNSSNGSQDKSRRNREETESSTKDQVDKHAYFNVFTNSPPTRFKKVNCYSNN